MLAELAQALKVSAAFATRGIPFASEVPFRLLFNGRPLTTRYRADFVCFGQVIVELKALAALTDVETAQVLNYLKAFSRPTRARASAAGLTCSPGSRSVCSLSLQTEAITARQWQASSPSGRNPARRLWRESLEGSHPAEITPAS